MSIWKSQWDLLRVQILALTTGEWQCHSLSVKEGMFGGREGKLEWFYFGQIKLDACGTFKPDSSYLKIVLQFFPLPHPFSQGL